MAGEFNILAEANVDKFEEDDVEAVVNTILGVALLTLAGIIGLIVLVKVFKVGVKEGKDLTGAVSGRRS